MDSNLNGTYLSHFMLFFAYCSCLVCRLAVSLRTPTMAATFIRTVGLRASAPTYEKPAFAAISSLSKCHSIQAIKIST